MTGTASECRSAGELRRRRSPDFVRARIGGEAMQRVGGPRGRHRLGEQVTLDEAAFEFLERDVLIGLLDTLGDLVLATLTGFEHHNDSPA